MHALLRTYQIQPGQIEERIRHYREVTLPIVGQRPGYRGVLILVDRATHKNLTIGLWESEAALQAAEQDPEYRVPLSHPRFAVGDVTTEYFEVSQIELPPDPDRDRPRAAQLTRFAVQPGRFDERLRFSREQTFPAARHVPGHLGAILLADRANARTIAIGLWRDAADIEASTDIEASAGNAGYQELRPHHRFAAGPVTHEQFEIAHYGLP